MKSKTENLRVLQVTPRYRPYIGGVETHVYEVARRMAKTKLDVTVLTADPTGDLLPFEWVDGVKVHRVRAWPKQRDYYFAPDLYPMITQGWWDVVHCQCYHTLVAPLAMLAAWRANIPYVVSFHSGGHSSGLRNSIRKAQLALLRPLLTRARMLIAVSKFEARYFQQALGVPPERIAVIPNGSYMPKIALPPKSAQPATIVSVGRLERYKGHHRLIEALPRILQARPDVRVQIVGSGPYEAQLHTLAQELQVADRVEIFATPPGNRQAMAELLAQSALVTLLSEYEAHPIAVMEALALQCSVLVADTSGLSELAEEGLVRAIPLQSSPEEVASAILDQLRHPLQPTAVELPTWDGCTNAIIKIYQACQQNRQDLYAGSQTIMAKKRERNSPHPNPSPLGEGTVKG